MSKDQQCFKSVLEDLLRCYVPEITILLAPLQPSKIAQKLEANLLGTRHIIQGLNDEDVLNLSLRQLPYHQLCRFFEKMDTAQLKAVSEVLKADDLANMLRQLP